MKICPMAAKLFHVDGQSWWSLLALLWMCQIMLYFRFNQSHTAQYIKKQLTSLSLSCSMFHDIVPELQIHEDELLNHISFSQLTRCLIKWVSVIRCVIYVFMLSAAKIDMIYLSTAIGLTPGGSDTVHIYLKTMHRTTKRQTIHRTTLITKEQHN